MQHCELVMTHKNAFFSDDKIIIVLFHSQNNNFFSFKTSSAVAVDPR